MIRSILSAFTFAFVANAATAQAPSVNYTTPAAVAPGKETTVTFFGGNLAGATGLWTSFPCQTVRAPEIDNNGTNTGKVGFHFTLSKDVPIGIGAMRLVTTNGISSLRLLMIDNLPSVTATGKNRAMQTAQELKLPVAIDGNCDELNSDYFQFQARKGQRVSIDVVAARLGSALDPLLRLLDSRGRELAYADDTPGAAVDARISYKFPAAGRYFLELRDSRYQGGLKHRYRMRVGDFPLTTIPFLPVESRDVLTSAKPLKETSEIEPNDTAAMATKISVPSSLKGQFAKPKDRDFYEFTAQKGQRLVIAGKTRSLGSPCDLFMRVYKADGSQLAEANVNGPDEGSITNTFAEAGTYRLMVEELNLQGGPELQYRVEVKPYEPGFALSVETEKVDAAPGGSFEMKVTAVRREFDGPITLSLPGAESSFVLTNNIIIDAKTNATQLHVTLPMELTPGQFTNLSIVGQAKIGDATFSATASTMPALRKLFPQMPYPPEELDGLIGLGIKAFAKSTETKPVETKPGKK